MQPGSLLLFSELAFDERQEFDGRFILPYPQEKQVDTQRGRTPCRQPVTSRPGLLVNEEGWDISQDCQGEIGEEVRRKVLDPQVADTGHNDAGYG